MPTKYIFVTGGVMSGVGKGVVTASIAKILQSRGFRVTAIKIDPYVNVDAGTMNPVEHGEVFVTDDGTECDQDVGNYERFLDGPVLKPTVLFRLITIMSRSVLLLPAALVISPLTLTSRLPERVRILWCCPIRQIPNPLPSASHRLRIQ